MLANRTGVANNGRGGLRPEANKVAGRFACAEVVAMPLVIPPDVTRPELEECIGNLRARQVCTQLREERAELRVEIDAALSRLFALLPQGEPCA